MSDLTDLRLLLDEAQGETWTPCEAYMDSDSETVWLRDSAGDLLAVGKHDVAAMLNALLVIQRAICDVPNTVGAYAK